MSQGWEYAASLAWPDADTTVTLGEGWHWDETCVDVVNNNGVAADPLGLTTRYGGVLHTPAQPSPGRLARLIEDVWAVLGPKVNYRTWTTVSVRVPRLMEDLVSLRQLVGFSRKHLPNVWPAIDPLEDLLSGQASPGDTEMARVYLETVARPVRRALLSARRHEVRMAATTVPQFLAAGNPGPELPRECLRVDWDGWVHLSCLAGVEDPDQVQAAITFTRAWILTALAGSDPLLVASRWGPRMPRQLRFDRALEVGWRHTNVRDNSRASVNAWLSASTRRSG